MAQVFQAPLPGSLHDCGHLGLRLGQPFAVLRVLRVVLLLACLVFGRFPCVIRARLFHRFAIPFGGFCEGLFYEGTFRPGQLGIATVMGSSQPPTEADA
jgi:hypothetical protein